jgi:hypothetical protein
MSRDGEIVSLDGGESFRSCKSHEVCVNNLAVGDLVKFNVTVTMVEE